MSESRATLMVIRMVHPVDTRCRAMPLYLGSRLGRSAGYRFVAKDARGFSKGFDGAAHPEAVFPKAAFALMTCLDSES